MKIRKTFNVLKTHHKQFLTGLHHNKKTTLWSIEKKRRALLYFHNDINSISWETVRKFYKEELNLRYKRCRKPVPPVELNYSALANLCCYIKDKL